MPEKTTNSVVNLGNLGKPADTLIKKISEAIGALYEPAYIRRIAQAKADAAIIQAKGKLEITALQRRALNRFVEEEAKRQQNIESITDRALPQLNDSAKPEQVDDDWITNFFDKSRIVSDTEMQEIWAKVLSGESNSPGKYSKRTVNFLADLDKADAQLFSALLSFSCEIADSRVPLILKPADTIFREQGITISSLWHLHSIGLIAFSPVGSMSVSFSEEITPTYAGRPLQLPPAPEPAGALTVGHVILTQVGQQLAAICPKQEVYGFFDYVTQTRPESGVSVQVANIGEAVQLLHENLARHLDQIQGIRKVIKPAN